MIKIKSFINDNNGMEFIDLGIIVIGSLLVLSAIYALISNVYENINNTPMGIPGKKAK